MNEQQIVDYLKENFTRGVAFRFMPNEVQRWCMKHRDEDIFFRFSEEYGWGSKQLKICCLNSSVYALDHDYELKPEFFKQDWVEFEIDENGMFSFEGKRYYYREDARFEIENRDKFKGFGGWLSCDGNWRTYPALYREIDDIACYNGSCDCECEPAVPLKIRFWRLKK